MAYGKGTIKLAINQALTNAYVVTNLESSTSVQEESNAVLDFFYTTGAAETATSLTYIIETSWNGTDWVQEVISSVNGGIDTQSTFSHTLAGGAGSTTYTTQYYLPLCMRYVRVLVKESGVSSMAGSITVYMTVAAGSGMMRNAQIEPSSSAASDVNLVEVGGAAISLGAKTAADSLPVVLPTSQITALSPAQVGTVYSGGASQTVLSAFVNVAASQTDFSIIAASASTVIYVLGLQMITGNTATNITFNSKGGGAGTAITPLFANASNGGAVFALSSLVYFKTNAGEALTVTSGSGATTGILVQYIQV